MLLRQQRPTRVDGVVPGPTRRVDHCVDDHLLAGGLIHPRGVAAQDHRQLLLLEAHPTQGPQIVMVQACRPHPDPRPAVGWLRIRALADHKPLQRVVGVERFAIDGSHPADPSEAPQALSVAGAASSACWTAATRARAASAVSSSATRAEGPRAGALTSMLSVCSAIAWTGWSKYTAASVTANQAPFGPFALPVSGICTVA